MADKIKGFFSWLGQKLAGPTKFIVGGIVLLAIIITGIVLSQKENNKKQTSSRPEIAQVFEPSIGTPLPAEVNVNEEPAVSQETNEREPGSVSGVTTPFIAPSTGVDPNKPIQYTNKELGFTITLPARSTVQEQNNTVSFFTDNGTLLASVAIVISPETLNDIQAQLNYSPDVKSLQTVELAHQPALKYSANNLDGYVIKLNNAIYYLMGQPEILQQFSI